MWTCGKPHESTHKFFGGAILFKNVPFLIFFSLSGNSGFDSFFFLKYEQTGHDSAHHFLA